MYELLNVCVYMSQGGLVYFCVSRWVSSGTELVVNKSGAAFRVPLQS